MESAVAARTEPEQPSRRRTPPAERSAVWAACAVGAAVGALGSGQPTCATWVDLVWRVGFAVLVVLAASRARRWAWIVSPAVLTVASEPWAWVALGGVALIAAVASVRLHRTRALGAGIGVACVALVAHLPPVDVAGGSATVAAVAVAPLLLSGYRSSPLSVRRQVRVGLAVVAVVLVVGAAVAVTAAMASWTDVVDAEAAARRGLEAAEGGETASATAQLRAAADGFGAAEARLGAWWASPARLVPVVSQHTEALEVATAHGRAVSEAAAASTEAVDLDQLRYTDRRIDLRVLADAAPALAATDAAVAEARAALGALDRTWLAGPLVGRLDDLEGELADVAPDTELAALAARRLPAVLGAEGPRRYLLAFTTPAELRGAGGFIGSWAVLEADDGRLALAEQGRADDVNSTPGRDERVVDGPEDYVARYGRFRPGQWFQDVTFTPDVPTAAVVAADVFAQAGFEPVDGVAFVDPEGLAALLRLTGPISVPGLDRRLGPDDAAEWLLRGQYLDQREDEEREDILADAASVTFETLLATDLPGPRRLADVLSGPTRGGHLSAVAFDEGADELLGRLGARRAFPDPDDGADLAGLFTQNAANNKIDVFLERSVTYDADVDPVTGEVKATATVELTNGAPGGGLPDSVIGSNDRGLPLGTNRMYVSWYSPLRLEAASLDGAPLVMERQQELGWYVYSTFLELAPGTTEVLELQLKGLVEPGSPYRLVVPAQPTVNPDRWHVRVDPAGAVPAEPPEVTFDAGDPRVVTFEVARTR